MVKPFISIDAQKLKVSVDKTKKSIQEFGREAVAAMQKATVDYMKFIVAEAHQKAPLGETGDLRGAANVFEEYADDGKTLIVTGGFFIKYARIRDVGGTIKAFRAKYLFIPLRKGIRPGQPGLKRNVDFVLKKQVTQKGNRYFSSTVEEHRRGAARKIGERVAFILKQKRKRGR
jgi:hypothetical protein